MAPFLPIPYTSTDPSNHRLRARKEFTDNVEPNRPTDAPAARAEDADRIQGTLMNFGDFKVRLQRRGDQTILEFSGAPGPALAQELERLAGRCRGDVGIDLSEVQGFPPALVPSLERVRKRLGLVRHTLFLCNPPSRLLDVLSLGGIAQNYPIAGEGAGLEIFPEEPRQSPRKEDPAAQAVGDLSRRDRQISYFDRSIKRTEKLEQNLDSAARCVRKMLPQREPLVPGWRFAFIYRQSEVVGGDFFDFLQLGPDLLGLCLGDVSGKGLEAAILMCLARKVIALRAMDGAASGTGKPGSSVGPGEVLARANKDLRSDLDRNSFITALFAVLDTSTGAFRFARAGHEQPVLFHPGSGEDPRWAVSGGPALGIFEDRIFRSRIQESRLDVRQGESVLLFTDGIVDARCPQGKMFTRRRLLDNLRRARPGQQPGGILAALMDEVSRHTGDGPAQDDMTALLISRECTGGS